MNKNKSQKILSTIYLSIYALIVMVLFLGYGIAVLCGDKNTMFLFGSALVVLASETVLVLLIAILLTKIWTEDKKKSNKDKEKK